MQGQDRRPTPLDVATEGRREPPYDLPLTTFVLRDDELDQVIGAGSNGIRFGQEGN